MVNWINDVTELERYCERLKEGVPIAIDTESDHFMSYRPRTCVIQICVEGDVAFVDALKFEGDQLSALSKICENENHLIILHSASNDIREMHRDFGSLFNSVFDTQIAMQFLNYEKHGLAFLLEKFEGLKISKKYQRYNWRTRPILQAAIDYAADDVLYLDSCRKKLVEELQASGWSDAFNQQCELICDQTRYEEKPFDEEGWRKIKQSKQLPDDETRGTFKSLYLWRHERCIELDRAPLHVLPNDLMAQIAFRRPETKSALKKIRGMNRVKKGDFSAILRAIRFGEGHKEPKRRRSEQDKPNQSYFDRFEKLRAWRNNKSEEISLPSPLIATNALLKALALGLRDGDLLDLHPEFLPWKKERFEDDILKIIS